MQMREGDPLSKTFMIDTAPKFKSKTPGDPT